MKITYEDYMPISPGHDKTGLYIFTDNINRSGGKQPIDHSSWYYQEFHGKRKEIFHPEVTTSSIRGCPNAFPICTQKYMWKNGSYEGSRWNDEDFDEFKSILDKDIKRIKDNLQNYDHIVFPLGGLFSRRVSQITMERCPKIYKYLMKQLLFLDKVSGESS